MTDELWDDPAWLVAEVQRQRVVLRNQFATNLWRNKQLDDIGEILCEAYDDVPEPEAVTKVRDVLQRPSPATLGPPEAMRVWFHWRDRSRPDGYSDALPGDGFGFCEYVENETRTGLMMQFDCAGISACVDMPVDMLRQTLARGGLVLLRLNESALSLVGFAEANCNEVTMAQQLRITELERDLKATEAENERLMARVYGEGDERDDMRIAVDRAAELMKEKEG